MLVFFLDMIEDNLGVVTIGALAVIIVICNQALLAVSARMSRRKVQQRRTISAAVAQHLPSRRLKKSPQNWILGLYHGFRLSMVRRSVLRILGESSERELALVALIEHLLHWPAHETRAILMMQFLGTEKANDLFLSLSKQAQKTVLQLMQEPAFRKAKASVLVRVGQDLLAQLTGEFSVFHNPYYAAIIFALRGIPRKDLVDVFMRLPLEQVPRLCLYLDSRQVQFVCDQIARISPSRFRKLCSALRVAEKAQTQDRHDKQLYELLSAVRGAALI